jgi:hypothetical protein
MSKTLFNQNTFSSKNVTNSNRIDTLKAEDIKATNATITNITNAELQAATALSQNNRDNFANFQTLLAPANQLNPTFIDFANNTIAQDITTSADITTSGGNVVINGDTTTSSGVTPPKLLVTDSANTGRSSVIEIRGKRNTTTTAKHAELSLTNYDHSPELESTNNLGSIVGEVENHSTNVGDMVFYTFPDGAAYTERMRMTSDGTIQIPSGTTLSCGGNVSMSSTLTMTARINSDSNITTTANVAGVDVTASGNMSCVDLTATGLDANDVVVTDGSKQLASSPITAIDLAASLSGYDPLAGSLTAQIGGKQATLTTGDGIDITGTTISFDGTISQGITSSGAIKGLSLKYVDGGVETDVQTKIDAIEGSSQEQIVAGANITLAADNKTISSTNPNIMTCDSITSSVSNTCGGILTVTGTTTAAAINCSSVTATGNVSGVGVTASGNMACVDVTASGDVACVDLTTTGEVKTTDINLANASNLANIGLPTSTSVAPNRTNSYSWLEFQDVFMNMGGAQVRLYSSSTTSSTGTLALTCNASNNVDVANDLTVGGGVQGDLWAKGALRNRWLRCNNTNRNGVNGGNWGSTGGSSGTSTSYANNFGSSGQRRVGDAFLTESFGIFTLTETGTYNVRVTVTNEMETASGRTTIAHYISINNQDDFPLYSNIIDDRGRVGCCYLRDTNSGVAGSACFGDYMYLATGDNVRIKCLIDDGDGNQAFDDVKTASSLNVYMSVEFEKIASTNVIVSGL